MKNVKTLIAYASKTGTARSCAERLAAYFPDCVLADLMQTSPNPAAYDIVIIGGGVRFWLPAQGRFKVYSNQPEHAPTKADRLFSLQL